MRKPDTFKCPICKEIRERGVHVKLGEKAGALAHVVVKVCKSKKCKELAQEGSITAEQVYLTWSS